jgi:hypothetical protein
MNQDDYDAKEEMINDEFILDTGRAAAVEMMKTAVTMGTAEQKENQIKVLYSLATHVLAHQVKNLMLVQNETEDNAKRIVVENLFYEVAHLDSLGEETAEYVPIED